MDELGLNRRRSFGQPFLYNHPSFIQAGELKIGNTTSDVFGLETYNHHGRTSSLSSRRLCLAVALIPYAEPKLRDGGLTRAERTIWQRALNFR